MFAFLMYTFAVGPMDGSASAPDDNTRGSKVENKVITVEVPERQSQLRMAVQCLYLHSYIQVNITIGFGR